jgi:hypothetical protein
MKCRAELQKLRTSQTSLREELTKQCWKMGKKLVIHPNHLMRLRHNFCLNNNTRTACWRCNTRTNKNAILLFLNLEFFYVLVCFVPCLFVHQSTCWFLGFSFFLFFSLFLLLSLFCEICYCKLTDTKLQTDQGQRNTKWIDGKMENVWKQFSPKK